jgi:membrane protein DedA with SNARE-associated domain
MALENIFPPLPPEVIMPLAGFTAQQGKLISLLWVVLAGSRAYRLNLYSI